jgi:ribosomal protein L37AE/L43A
MDINNDINTNEKVFLMKQERLVEVHKCPFCNSENIKWHLSATKECKECNKVFRAEVFIEQ